jgi:hypothetical protein
MFSAAAGREPILMLLPRSTPRMKGDGEPVFEHEFPPGTDIMTEIREALWERKVRDGTCFEVAGIGRLKSYFRQYWRRSRRSRRMSRNDRNRRKSLSLSTNLTNPFSSCATDALGDMDKPSNVILRIVR